MARPPPQPTYILRGHGSQICAAEFIRKNARLFTGDVEGWVVLWDLAVKRPTAVWRAHQASILGLNDWSSDKLITHGKDNKLLVWKLDENDEVSMSNVLPVDVSNQPRKQPWLLYSLNVNTLNFCSFVQTETLIKESPTGLLIAVPDIMSSEKVEIYHLPSSTRLHIVPASPLFKGGMIMCLAIFCHPSTSLLTVVAGFESGHTTINYLINSSWTTIYMTQPHTQPILSLAVAPEKNHYLTSSADAIIAEHVIPSLTSVFPDIKNVELVKKDTPCRHLNTKHAGQQDIKIRNDGKIFATAGWDSRVRVYSSRAFREIAVLKWHKQGCYAVAFAKTNLSSIEKRIEDEKYNLFVKGSDLNDVEQVKIKNGVVESNQPSPSTVVSEIRVWKAQNTHWIAVGSKDGKISLWDIY